LGDILLNEGQTVESVIYDSRRQAFIESGYTVIQNNANISKSSRINERALKDYISEVKAKFKVNEGKAKSSLTLIPVPC